MEVADRFLQAANDTFQTLASQPKMGAPVFVRRKELYGMRRFPVSDGFERVIIFYLPAPDGVEVVRAIHASRNLERLLSEGLSE
jgi:toxin ParE1/3/4